MLSLDASNKRFLNFQKLLYKMEVTFNHAFTPSNGPLEDCDRQYEFLLVKQKLDCPKVGVSLFFNGKEIGCNYHSPKSTADPEMSKKRRSTYLEFTVWNEEDTDLVQYGKLQE